MPTSVKSVGLSSFPVLKSDVGKGLSHDGPSARSSPVWPNFPQTPAIAGLVLASLQYGSEIKHYDLHSWVIMPNRVHSLLTPQVSVSKLLNSLKAATARRANLILHRTGQPFWQDESYDHSVRDPDEFQRIQHYIENNPVTAGLAGTGEQYPWSSRAACDAAAAHGAAPPNSV